MSQILSAYPTGVLRVRPVQAQRATGDPVADPRDEGSGPVGGSQGPRESPHHGVAKTATWTETHLCLMNHYDGGSSVPDGASLDIKAFLLSSETFRCYYRRRVFNFFFGGGGVSEHFCGPKSETKAGTGGRAALQPLIPASGATSVFQLGMTNTNRRIFFIPFF